MRSEITVDALRILIEKFVEGDSRRLRSAGWWLTPLVATAGVDQRFDQLPGIASEDHLHPRDLLPLVRSVVVFFIPFKKELVKENRKGDRPCRNWAIAYIETNDLIGRLGEALGGFLAEYGYTSALTPATHNFDEVKLMSRWSHKHLGHLVGLGRFGVHCMLITPAGCTGRLGSLVTDAEFGDHPLVETDHACLQKAGQRCGQCVEACPVGALRQDGFDRQRCSNRLNQNRATVEDLFDLPETTHVCGKCVALMPCSFKNPVARQGDTRSAYKSPDSER